MNKGRKDKMVRAAGSDTHYTFSLNNRPEVKIKLPSVTSIIKSVMSPAFGPASYWGFKLGVQAGLDLAGVDYKEDDYENAKKTAFSPNAQRDKAGSRGTSAHEYLEQLANQEAYQDPTNGYERAVEAWWMKNKDDIEVIACEVPVFSLKHQYAGTIDLIYRDDNDDYIFCDLKTHKGKARIEDHLQVAAYQLAWEEMNGVNGIAMQMVLLAREDGTYEESFRYMDPQAFLNIREVYREVEAYGG